MNENRAALGTLLVWAAVGAAFTLPEPWLARPYLDEGGPIEAMSAIVAGAAASIALITLARHARRHGGTPTRGAVREALVVAGFGVLWAGEELSWGEGLVWEASTEDRSRRLDALHDILNLLATKIPAELVAGVEIFVGIVVIVVAGRLFGLALRRVGFSLGILAVAAAIDTLHRPGIPLLAAEEVGELLSFVWLAAAGVAVGASERRRSEPQGGVVMAAGPSEIASAETPALPAPIRRHVS